MSAQVMLGAARRAGRAVLQRDLGADDGLKLARLYEAHEDAARIGGEYGDGRVAGIRLTVPILLNCTHDQGWQMLHAMRRDKAAG